jgi:hypothetical protein
MMAGLESDNSYSPPQYVTCLDCGSVGASAVSAIVIF